MPQFDLQIIRRLDQPISRVGEVPITNASAAVTNAIFNATGVHVRQVLFTPARVNAAPTA